MVKKVLICCVYRAPNTNLCMLSEFLTNILRNVRKNTVYMCGDFNVDLLQFDKHGATNDFIDQIYTLGLHPLITRPTRITSHSKTLIDNIFTSDLSSEIHSGLIINDVSDHLPIYQITEYAHCTNKKIVYNKRRVVNETNLAVLINDLKETNWNTVIHSENVNFMYDTFSEKLANSYNKNCPIMNEKKRKKRTDKPWMTKSLINACKKKNLLYREFLKKRTDECESKYKRYKNKLTSILRYCEKQYYTEILDLNKGNVKETWKIINSLINKQSKKKMCCTEFSSNGHTIIGDKNVVNGFNQFPALASDIPKSDSDNDFIQYLSNMNNMDSLYIEPVTEEEIIQLVNNAKSKTSKGHDDLDMCLVKKIIPYVVTPLKHIFNTSLQKGIFPDSMKKARVIPLFKSGDVKEFSNYRPVSLLPQFSKRLERVFHKRLMSFLDKKYILYKSQYGFRKNMSTSLAILELVEEITNAIDDCKSTVGVFIDLKKAFDTVDHNILIKN